MKKTLLITTDFPPKTGGVANYYFQLCKNLPASDISVLTNHFSAQQNTHFSVETKKLLWSTKKLGWLPMVFHIGVNIFQSKPEYVWVGQVLPVGPIVWLWSKILPFRYFVSFHGMDANFAHITKRKKYWFDKIVDSAEFVVANSEFTKELLIGYGVPDAKIQIIYPCPDELSLPDRQLREQLIEKYHLHNKKIILSVGRLVARKGFDTIISAFSEILIQVPDAHYVIVGDGKYRKQLEEIVLQNNLSDSVTFTGLVDSVQRSTWYELADIFAMPCREIDGDVEGFGIVFLEAGSFALASVAGNTGGCTEAVIDGVTGIGVDPKDTKQLVNACIKLLSDVEYAKKLGENAKQRIFEKFSWKMQGEILEERIDSAF